MTDTDADFIDMSNETTDDSDIEFLDGPSAAGPSSRPDETAGGEVAATDTKRKGRGDTDLDAPSTPSTSTSYRPTTFTPFRPMTFGMVVDAEDDDEQDEQEDGEIVESSTPAAKTSKNSPPPGDKGDPVQSKPVVHDRYDSGNESVLLLPGHVTIASAHAEGEEGEEEDDSPMEDVEGVYTVDDDRARVSNGLCRWDLIVAGCAALLHGKGRGCGGLPGRGGPEQDMSQVQATRTPREGLPTHYCDLAVVWNAS